MSDNCDTSYPFISDALGCCSNQLLVLLVKDKLESSETKIESANYLSILDICSVWESALKDELCNVHQRKKYRVWGFFPPSNLQQDSIIESWETESATDCNVFPIIFFDGYFGPRISVPEKESFDRSQETVTCVILQTQWVVISLNSRCMCYLRGTGGKAVLIRGDQ